MCRYPNLQTAIDECRKLGKEYSYKNIGKHIKFYIGEKRIILSKNNDNPDRVRKDVRRIVLNI